METITLDEHKVWELVSKNKYEVDPKRRFLSRCIDGRYPNDDDLPPLAFPGGDAGQLDVVFATANKNLLNINREKVYESIVEVVGGEENFSMHTDTHATELVRGCGNEREHIDHPKDYGLTDIDKDFLLKKLPLAKEKGAKETIVEGDHLERAVLFVNGNYSVKPRFMIETSSGPQLVEVFVYHRSLADERNKKLAEVLVKNKALWNTKVKEDAPENLATLLIEMSDDHAIKIAKELAKGLPIFIVTFSDDGSFEIKDGGVVE